MNFYLLIVIAVGVFLAMTGAWAIQRLTGMSGWIDTIWSLTIGVGGSTAVILAEGIFARRMTVLIAITAWALRLAWHIGTRTKFGGEDPRYAKLMEDWGASASWRLFLFLQVQALAALILIFTVYLAAANDKAYPSGQDFLAALLAAAALIGETTSDAQLAQFRLTPEAKTDICETGLWYYSRHPNYFFEWLFWCALPVFAITNSPVSLLSLLAPALMYWLLVHVSGIPPLEEHMLRSRGEKFRALQRRVNAFFPGPRKSETLLKENDQ